VIPFCHTLNSGSSTLASPPLRRRFSTPNRTDAQSHPSRCADDANAAR
jgi:hypothetical protein